MNSLKVVLLPRSPRFRFYNRYLLETLTFGKVMEPQLNVGDVRGDIVATIVHILADGNSSVQWKRRDGGWGEYFHMHYLSRISPS